MWMKRREVLTFDTRGVQSQQIHYFMKKFTMLGASLVAFLVATACMSSATKMQKNEAGGEKTVKISATMEGLTFQSDHIVANDVILENTAATEIKTGYAMEVAGILPDETVIVSKSGLSLAGKNKVENQTCTCANCIAKNAAVIAGGNYS